MESRVYSGNDAIPADKLISWYRINPVSFWIVFSGKHKRIGHINVLPLREKTLQELISGSITEQDIKSSDLYPPERKEDIRDLYIESLVIALPGGIARARALLRVLLSFQTIAGTISNPKKLKNVYAISASHEGSALLEHLGFRILKYASERRDQHNLFCVSYIIFENRVKEIIGQA